MRILPWPWRQFDKQIPSRALDANPQWADLRELPLHEQPRSAAGTNYQIPFTAATASTTTSTVPGAAGVAYVAGVFSNHHPEGDEYRTSPHQNMGCSTIDQLVGPAPTYSCHDPHSSVWHNDGGVAVGSVKFNVNADPSDPTYAGNMCLTCHGPNSPIPASTTATKGTGSSATTTTNVLPPIRIRGPMGDIGLACIDCHMPEISAGSIGATGTPTAGMAVGTRKAHIFKINNTKLTAAQNTYTVSGKKYWVGDAGVPAGGGLIQATPFPTARRSRWISSAPLATTT